MRGVLRMLVLSLALGVVIAFAVVASYWGLESLLASYTDHDRGLWEGAVVVTVINGGNVIARRVLKCADAKKHLP